MKGKIPAIILCVVVSIMNILPGLTIGLLTAYSTLEPWQLYFVSFTLGLIQTVWIAATVNIWIIYYQTFGK